MSGTLESNIETARPAKELGFSIRQGVDWFRYLAYRPVYPVSFFKRIYDYHSQKPETTWSVAHDVGTGCGIVSATLASRFNSVIVSDSNDGYVTLARKILVEESILPESQFTFLQEPAEQSSIKSGTVDLVAACECLHWTDTHFAIKEFGRELKSGGTLVIAHYTIPRIIGNERGKRAWKEIWNAHSKRTKGELFDNAFRVVNTGHDSLEFPEREWEVVKRVYINARGSTDNYMINDRIGENKVKAGEERIWVENDEDWCDRKGIDWFKEYFATWVPRIPESEIRGHWEDFELALGGKDVEIETPVVMIFATKKERYTHYPT